MHFSRPSIHGPILGEPLPSRPASAFCLLPSAFCLLPLKPTLEPSICQGNSRPFSAEGSAVPALQRYGPSKRTPFVLRAKFLPSLFCFVVGQKEGLLGGRGPSIGEKPQGRRAGPALRVFRLTENGLRGSAAKPTKRHDDRRRPSWSGVSAVRLIHFRARG